MSMESSNGRVTESVRSTTSTSLRRWLQGICGLFVLGSLSGCSGALSALEPAGPQAESLASLFWGMAIGTGVIWLGMVALAIWAIRADPDPSKTAKRAKWLIVFGGAAIPTTVLAGLLFYALSMMPGMVAPAPEGSLKIRVMGEQWWWRVRYLREGEPVELANEIRIPVGEPVQFELMSSNVIHAFWIPALGGKRDMIPGRTIGLALTASKTGLFRGICAEYCGTSHALMGFMVEVMEKEAFDRWLENQASEAVKPVSPESKRGEHLFLANGCGACHTVRGTHADGVIAPDLTHLGSRFTLGAGILTNDSSALKQWISHPARIKPSVHMPAFGMLSLEDRDALAAYLKGLK